MAKPTITDGTIQFQDHQTWYRITGDLTTADPGGSEIELAGFTVTVNVAVELTVSMAASLTENCRIFVFQRIEPNRPGIPPSQCCSKSAENC